MMQNLIYGKIPPQAVDLEKCVLGAMLIDKDAIPVAAEILHSECFYDESNKRIFDAIVKLFDKGKPVDTLTVSEQLKVSGELENAGGYHYLSQLTGSVFSAAHIEHHCMIVKQKYIRRSVIQVGSQSIAEAYDDSVEDLDVLSNYERSMSEVINTSITGETKDISDVVTSIFTSKKQDIGVPVVMAGLHEKVRIFQNTDLIILAARPSMGKTAYALQIAKETAMQGIGVAVFSLEMSAKQLVTRLITSETGIAYDKISNNEMDEYETKQALSAGSDVSMLPIYIDDTTGINDITFRSKAIKMKRKYDVGLIVIDYLQLMSGSGKTNNREQEISQISRKLKQVAKELNVPVLALSQLSRRCEERSDKKPMLSDLRESGAIEQDADCVIFLYRPEYYSIKEIEKDGRYFDSHGVCESIISKHRNGKTGSCFANFNGMRMRFSEFSTFQEVTKQGNYL